MGKDVIVACDFDSKEKTLAFLDKFQGKKPFARTRRRETPAHLHESVYPMKMK